MDSPYVLDWGVKWRNSTLRLSYEMRLRRFQNIKINKYLVLWCSLKISPYFKASCPTLINSSLVCRPKLHLVGYVSVRASDFETELGITSYPNIEATHPHMEVVQNWLIRQTVYSATLPAVDPWGRHLGFIGQKVVSDFQSVSGETADWKLRNSDFPVEKEHRKLWYLVLSPSYEMGY